MTAAQPAFGFNTLNLYCETKKSCVYYPSAMCLWGILCKNDGKDNISLFYFTVHQEIGNLHSLKNPHNNLLLQVCILLMLFPTESVDFFFLAKNCKYKNQRCLMRFADWICLMTFGPFFIHGPYTLGQLSSSMVYCHIIAAVTCCFF